MSDFYSVFWDYYVAILTLVSVVACAVLLWTQGKRRVTIVEGTQPDTTGHVWDGDLREYQNPMPRWWILLFYFTIVFAIVYLILFPGLGTQFKGILGWSQEKQHADEVKAASAKYDPIFTAYLQQPIEKVALDVRARQMGERIFQNNCAPCHGSDARGGKGFPNLTDADWLYGGSPDAIETSIANGRNGVMPPMAAAVGNADDVTNVANYVLSLSGSAHDSARAANGREKFVACAACHGADGRGNQTLGAPNLSDKIWLYGGTVEAITETITRGRGSNTLSPGQSAMPAWKDALGPAQVHIVAAYVWSLSNPTTAGGAGPAPAAEPAKK